MFDILDETIWWLFSDFVLGKISFRYVCVCTVWPEKNAANFQMKNFEFFFSVNLLEILHASTYGI